MGYCVKTMVNGTKKKDITRSGRLCIILMNHRQGDGVIYIPGPSVPKHPRNRLIK